MFKERNENILMNIDYQQKLKLKNGNSAAEK